tara:strand:+ start:5448 stop:5711 length:264 start_codon:yes stop_codon:yes gene_type:complete
MNVVAYILSFCKRPERNELIDDNIYILKQIYDETNDFAEESDSESETSDSEDDDYEPPEDVSDTDTSDGEGEEIIIKKDSNGHYYIY